jgi:hypothetical protein
MDEPRAQRTLVKSPPELWAEVSDAGALAGHLGAFGEVRITRLEPESTVAWEGDRARGTVQLEPSGWGTKVTLTALIEDAPVEEEPEPEPAAAPQPEPALPPAAPPPSRRRGLLARLFGRRRALRAQPEAPPPEVAAPRPPEPPPPPEPQPAAPANEPAPLDAGRAEEILVGVLDDLGAARHRPFSRA